MKQTQQVSENSFCKHN